MKVSAITDIKVITIQPITTGRIDGTDVLLFTPINYFAILSQQYVVCDSNSIFIDTFLREPSIPKVLVSYKIPVESDKILVNFASLLTSSSALDRMCSLMNMKAVYLRELQASRKEGIRSFSVDGVQLKHSTTEKWRLYSHIWINSMYDKMDLINVIDSFRLRVISIPVHEDTLVNIRTICINWTEKKISYEKKHISDYENMKSNNSQTQVSFRFFVVPNWSEDHYTSNRSQRFPHIGIEYDQYDRRDQPLGAPCRLNSTFCVSGDIEPQVAQQMAKLQYGRHETFFFRILSCLIVRFKLSCECSDLLTPIGQERHFAVGSQTAKVVMNCTAQLALLEPSLIGMTKELVVDTIVAFKPKDLLKYFKRNSLCMPLVKVVKTHALVREKMKVMGLYKATVSQLHKDSPVILKIYAREFDPVRTDPVVIYEYDRLPPPLIENSFIELNGEEDFKILQRSTNGSPAMRYYKLAYVF